jgi:hypothetical protein
MSAAQSESRQPPSTKGDPRTHIWMVAAALSLPWLLPLVSNYAFAYARDLHPTGFIQGDLPYYMANAREAFDAASQGSFTPWYGNPFTHNYDTPRIYFQPLIFLLGVAGWISRLDPGVLLAIANVVGALVCGVVAIRLFDHFVTEGSRPARRLTLVSFFWGGGLLCLTGLAYSLWRYGDGRTMLVLDPGDGWWFQNFGRNLVFATEAFYHALFFGAIVALLNRRFALSIVLTAFLSASHPFTGIQLLAVLIAWTMLERFILRNATIPDWFLGATLLLGVAHVGYYLLFLPTFEEHRQVMEQWKKAWILDAGSLIPAYVMVGALVVGRLRTTARIQSVRADPAARLLVVWFLVSLALANHDLFIKPIQPLHFTRGYIWVPLFLLGAPTLVGLYQSALSRRSRVSGRVAAAFLWMVFASDNVLWLAEHVSGEALSAPHHSTGIGLTLSHEQWELLQWLNRPENAGYIVVSEEPNVGYLTTVYTPLRSWRSHENNTPRTNHRAAELERFFTTGVPADGWRPLPLLIIYAQALSASIVRNGEIRLSGEVFRNSDFVVYRKPATPG